MLAIFKHNSPFAFLLLFALAVYAEYHKPLEAHVIMNHQSTLLYKTMLNFFENPSLSKSFLGSFIRSLAIFGEALYLNKVASDNKLLGKSNALVALTFLLFNFLVPYKSTFLALIINGMLIFIFQLYIGIYKKNKPFNEIILSGFIIAVITLFINSYLILYVWLTISLLIMRPSSLREWGMLNIGFFMPYYFIASILYLVDAFSLGSIVQLIQPSIKLPSLSFIVSFHILAFILLPIIGFIVGGNQVGKMVLQNRKAYIIMFALFLGALLLNLLNTSRVQEYIFFCIVPATILFAPFFQAFKKDFIPNLVLIFIILLSYFR